MRAARWRTVALGSCLALLALMVFTSVAAAAVPAQRFLSPFSVSGATPRSEPVGRAAPSGQRRYLGAAPATSPWSPITNVPSGFFPGSMLLGLDGSVYVHQDNTGTWYRLRPSSTGSYASGAWTKLPAMPTGYQPEYFASQILSDGRMLIEGGEYNGTGTEVWTNKGAIYDPVANKWTNVHPPTGWTKIGDAQSVLLNDGRFMMAHPFDDGSTTGTDFADAL